MDYQIADVYKRQALEGDPAGVLGEDVAAFTDERLEEISRAVKRGWRIRL